MNPEDELLRKTIEVKTPKGFKILYLQNLIYVRAEKKFSIIFLTDDIDLITFHSLKWFEERLLKPSFFRCHNSYIVNCKFIDFYKQNEIKLKGGERILLARNKKSMFKDNLTYFVQELSSFL